MGSRFWARFKGTRPIVLGSGFRDGFKATRPSPFVQAFSRYLFASLVWIPVAMFITDHVFDITKIRGPSMMPYFNERYNETTLPDLCLTWKVFPHDNLQRGMIITFRNPLRPEALTTKRIVALPGDLVHTRAPFPQLYVRVPPFHVWVEGDGEQTLDSNTYGPISIRLIQGHITHILWPLRKAGRVKWWEHPDRLAAFRE